MIPQYPHVFKVGDEFTEDLLRNDVVVQEKIDGELFGFGITNENQLVFFNKNGVLEDLRLYGPVVEFATKLGFVQNGGYKNQYYFFIALFSPVTRKLAYKRTPRNYLVLVDMHVEGKWVSSRKTLEDNAFILGVDLVPQLYNGKVNTGFLSSFFETESFLGGANIEGVIIKNYSQTRLVDGHSQYLYAKVDNPQYKVTKVPTELETLKQSPLERIVNSIDVEEIWSKVVADLEAHHTLHYQRSDIPAVINHVKSYFLKHEMEPTKMKLYESVRGLITNKLTTGLSEYYDKFIESYRKQKAEAIIKES